MGVISKTYLIAYNLALTVGWAYVAYLAWQEKDNHTKMWKTVEWPLKIFQSAALLEVSNSKH
jgi:threonine/homoserine/homoserine lactone efflux protein